MARILGVEIPNKKKVGIALTYIYGIGNSSAKKILKDVDIDFNKKVKELDDASIAKIANEIQNNNNYNTEGQLHRYVRQSIQRLKDINCYRGIRHKRSLPVRGQKTKTNSRTRKGPRKTVAGKKRAVK